MAVAQLRNPGIGYGLCPNMSRGPLRDPRVRRALAKLIDRAALQPILDSVGYAAATSVLAAPTRGYRDCAAELAYDPAAARRLIGRVRPSLEVVFNSTFSPVDAELLAAVAAQWAAHGVRLVLADVDFAELRDRQQSGDYDFRFLYFTGADPDVLRFQFGFDQRNMNRRTRCDDLDRMLDAQLSCPDVDARRVQVHQIQRQIIADGRWLPICDVRTVTSFRPENVSGVRLDAEALTRIP